MTKNLFLRDKKRRAFLVTALADTPVDLKALSRRLGVGSGNLSWGAPALLAATLRVEPGCVTPLAAANARASARCAVLLDARLRGAGHVFVHPIVNAASVRLTADGLAAFLRAVGRAPLFVDFEAAPDTAAPADLKHVADGLLLAAPPPPPPPPPPAQARGSAAAAVEAAAGAAGRAEAGGAAT